ncbi:hypothetical protein F5J12DRAFT_786666 [Pisolithus orientalis]|uniref:uncharacterized protein n=1 Tax=Pisolithus orientalis TaxID=936130 RepID=UPI0022240382|nr:uncharacterized protein F5J12DRAFT_786666 [Pisolithus orientalis]KAI5989392.1 hypothetical protein F5J12DRAFT_786666 [Pisolithus orientalis]
MKNILNQHPKLKMLEMCGIRRLNMEDCLLMMSKHINGLPDQMELEDIEDCTVWRPVWSEHVDNMVNQRFLGAVVDAIMQEEMAKHAQSKGELEDDDHVSSTVKMMAKQYWRTLMSEICAAANPTKQEKVDGRLREKHHQTRWSQLTDCQQEAVRKFKRKYDVQGADTMLDSAFGSNHYSVGEEGWSPDSNSMLHFFISSTPYTSNGKKEERASLAWIILQKWDNFTPSFGPNLSKLEDRPPHSNKATPMIPFKMMINDAWLTAHPSQQVIDGMDWLKGFYSCAKEGASVNHFCWPELSSTGQIP